MSAGLRLFRKVSIAEGWSSLLLLGIAMPLKYIWGYPLAVKLVGWAHGVLFVAYGVIALKTAREEGWTPAFLFGALVASVLPFGPFIFDRRLDSQMGQTTSGDGA